MYRKTILHIFHNEHALFYNFSELYILVFIAGRYRILNVHHHPSFLTENNLSPTKSLDKRTVFSSRIHLSLTEATRALTWEAVLQEWCIFYRIVIVCWWHCGWVWDFFPFPSLLFFFLLCSWALVSLPINSFLLKLPGIYFCCLQPRTLTNTLLLITGKGMKQTLFNVTAITEPFFIEVVYTQVSLRGLGGNAKWPGCGYRMPNIWLETGKIH